MSSNVIHQAPSARRQASPSKRTTGNTSHSCFAVSLVAAAIALAACPAMAAGMVTAGSGAGVAVLARRVQPLEPIRSLLAPTPEHTVLIAATLAKPVSQSAPTPRPSPKSAEKAQLSYSWIPCPISFILGTLARAVSRSVKIPLATTAQPFLVSTITPVRSAT